MTLDQFTAEYSVPDGDYYGPPGAEQLHSTDPLEALGILIEDRMDGMGIGPASFAEAIAKGPVELAAYTREPPDDAWLRQTAESAMEALVSTFDESFGDLEGPSTVGREEEDAFMAAAVTLIRSLHVWRCAQTWSRVFSPDELRVIFAEEVRVQPEEVLGGF